jgi:hypothetical protein
MAGLGSCADLNLATQDQEDRVGQFADAKPGCACEQDTLSEYSPGIVEDNETILRMVCVPMHIHSKKPELKSSFFSHIASFGASVQRLEKSTDEELTACVEGLVSGAEDRVWLGYVQASARAIRDVQVGKEGKQSFCVADAALENNRAHAEIHCAYRIPEADRIEYRVQLMNVFKGKTVLNRRSVRDGAIWNALGAELKTRALPPQWADLA